MVSGEDWIAAHYAKDCSVSEVTHRVFQISSVPEHQAEVYYCCDPMRIDEYFIDPVADVRDRKGDEEEEKCEGWSSSILKNRSISQNIQGS